MITDYHVALGLLLAAGACWLPAILRSPCRVAPGCVCGWCRGGGR